MISLDEYPFKGKKALVRVDFNVPLAEQKISDDTRIKAALPSIEKMLNEGAAVVLMSHLGRPKGKQNELSLSPIAKHLSSLTKAKVYFANDCIGSEATQAAKNLKPGEILLLENLRFHPEEEAGVVSFAKSLASLGDVYVNDAFGTAHRAHASTSVIAQFFPENKVAGYLLQKEVESIGMVLEHGEKPVLAIVGGAKVSSKLSILKNLLGKVDEIIIGGGMAFTFFKAQGFPVGKSLVELDLIDTAKQFLREAEKIGLRVHLPKDVRCSTRFANDGSIHQRKLNEIKDNEMGLDVGEESNQYFGEVISRAKTILWNGPMGVFELSNFAQGTISIAKKVTEQTAKGAFTVVGGGDSVTAINQFNLADKISHVSTGGGAMLEYIEGKVLPGVAALN